MKSTKLKSLTPILMIVVFLSLLVVGAVGIQDLFPNPTTCTALTVSAGDTVLFGNNEDYSNPDGLIGFYPPSSQGYGMVKVGYLRKSGGETYPSYQGGMNDQGVAWDVLSIPRAPLTPHPEKPFDFWDDNFLGKILRENASVQEVIELAERFDFGDQMGLLIHVADASDDAVLIGPGPDGEVIFTRKGIGDGYLVSVNHNPAIPERNKDFLNKIAGRYDTAVRLLDEVSGTGSELTASQVASILDSVHLSGSLDAFFNSYTVYSNIFDLRNGVVHLYYLSQYDEMVTLDLAKELAKGERVIPMDELFSPETQARALSEYKTANTLGNLMKFGTVGVILLAIGLPVFMLIRRVKRRSKPVELSVASSPVKTPGEKASRWLEIDALRGLIIVFMALDHANLFIAQRHSSGEYWGGPFPMYREVLPFLTRFVTHFCAPGFFFLMGVGMLFFSESRRQRGWSNWQITKHFLLRGGVLIALQFLVVNRAWELSPGGWGINLYFGVLYALGGAMILGAFTLRLKPRYLIGLCLILLLGTELLVPDALAWGRQVPLFQSLLFTAGGDSPELWVNYPVLAWLELVVFGVLFGRWLKQDREMAYRRSLYLGVALLLLFGMLRALDGFGNLRPQPGDTWMDFLNPVKYPPSITFNLLTTGVNLLVLRLFVWLSEKRPQSMGPLAVFGQVPLFFYVLHLFLYAGLGNWLTPTGTSIPQMMLFWFLGLLILYPLCRWYSAFKHRQPANSVFRFV